MYFENIPHWFGKPFTCAETEILRKSAEKLNRTIITKPADKAAG